MDKHDFSIIHHSNFDNEMKSIPQIKAFFKKKKKSNYLPLSSSPLEEIKLISSKRFNGWQQQTLHSPSQNTKALFLEWPVVSLGKTSNKI